MMEREVERIIEEVCEKCDHFWGYHFEGKEKVGIHCCDNQIPETCPTVLEHYNKDPFQRMYDRNMTQRMKMTKIKCSWIGCDNSISRKWVMFQGGLMYVGWATFILNGKRYNLCPKCYNKFWDMIEPIMLGEDINAVEG